MNYMIISGVNKGTESPVGAPALAWRSAMSNINKTMVTLNNTQICRVLASFGGFWGCDF